MKSSKLTIALTVSLGLCTLAAADKKPKVPRLTSAAQHDKQVNSAERAEVKADVQRAAELK